MQLKKNPHSLIFLHIPKTAGVTFGDFLARFYHPDVRSRYKTEVPLNEYYFQIYTRRKTLRLLRGHFPFGLHRFIKPPFLYLTFLRDPIERSISLYYFFKEWEDSPIYEQVRKMTFEEFLESRITQFSDNGMVRQLSGVGNEQIYGQCTQEMLETAKQNLSKYFLIGLVEEFDKSLALFADLLGWPDIAYEKRNVTSSRPKKREVSEETLQIIKKYNQLDIELYKFGKELFSKQLLSPKEFLSSRQSVDNKAKESVYLFFGKRILAIIKKKIFQQTKKQKDI